MYFFVGYLTLHDKFLERFQKNVFFFILNEGGSINTMMSNKQKKNKNITMDLLSGLEKTDILIQCYVTYSESLCEIWTAVTAS